MIYKNKVSVIIPVYNAELSLEKCINSIQNQNYCNLEIILINDGSTDKSLDICNKKKKEDSRIVVIDIDNNGVSTARNQGIDVATGEYCCFVDSDDWIEEDHIYKMVCNIDNYDAVVVGYYRDWSSHSEKAYLSPLIMDFNKITVDCSEFYINGFIHPCWNKMFRTHILKKYKIYFNKEIHISEDTLFCIEYFSHCHQIIVLPETTYHYWNSDGSLSKKVYSDIFEIYMKVYHELDDLLIYGNCDENLKKIILNNTIWPQLYNTILKTLLNDNLTKTQKKLILNETNYFSDYKEIFEFAGSSSNNFNEKIILYLMKNKYFKLLNVILRLKNLS